ncbi:MAG: helix-turn-helix transcriptional regulator [Clostridiales bacterium]|nr:helix-turn-helix transcriptional regulator [Clostridiales bacterium]
MKNNIERERKVRGLTQSALGELLGVSRQTIISIERGRYNPSLALAFQIARVFGCTIEDIFVYDEEEEST